MISWLLALALSLAMLALALPGASTLAMGACVVAAFLGPVRTLQGLMVATLVMYANPHFVKHGTFDGVIFRLVLISAVLRVLFSLRASDVRLIWPVWLFALVALCTSWSTSPALAISLMKIGEFTFATTAVLIAFNHLKPNEVTRLQSWFLTVGLTVIALSALMLLKPGLGAGSNGGLQGLLNQPQALGIFIAPFAAWSISGVLLMRRRSSWIEVWVAIGTIVLIILTRARTAGFATFIGVAVVTLGRALSRRTASQATLGRSVAVVGAALIAVAAIALTTGKLSQIVTEYAFKGTETESRADVGDAFYESRGGGIIAEWNHFLQRPLTGNGFGVYPDGKFPTGVTYFKGIPISAPVEKGFLPSAVLEEDGLLGGILLTLVIVWLGRHAWRNADLRWRAMYVACLGINVGECVFLSPGGIGLFDWLLVGLAIAAYRSNRVLTGLRQAAPVDSAAAGEPEPATHLGAAG